MFGRVSLLLVWRFCLVWASKRESRGGTHMQWWAKHRGNFDWVQLQPCPRTLWLTSPLGLGISQLFCDPMRPLDSFRRSPLFVDAFRRMSSIPSQLGRICLAPEPGGVARMGSLHRDRFSSIAFDSPERCSGYSNPSPWFVFGSWRDRDLNFGPWEVPFQLFGVTGRPACHSYGSESDGFSLRLHMPWV